MRAIAASFVAMTMTVSSAVAADGMLAPGKRPVPKKRRSNPAACCWLRAFLSQRAASR